MAIQRRRSSAVLSVVGGAFLLCGVIRAADPLQDKALRAAVVPDADLLISGDAAGWRELPIQKTLEAIQAELEAKAPPGSQAGAMQARFDKFTETLGVTQDDINAIVVSARTRGLEGLSAATQGPPTSQLVLQRLGLVVAVRTAKPLSAAKIRLALSNAAAEQGMELMFEKSDYKGAAILSLVRPDQPGTTTWLPRDLAIAVLDGDTGAYIGTDTDVKAAVDRFAAATPAPLADTMGAAQKAALPGSMSSVFFVPSDSMRTQARERGNAMQAQNPMLAGALQSLAGLQHVVLGAKGSDRISARLGATFSSAEEAVQMKTMMDAMVLGMGKMMLMQAIGKPIPLIQSLNSLQNGPELALVADLTEEDCRALAELSLKAQQGAPGTSGATGGGGPVGIPAPQPEAPAN